MINVPGMTADGNSGNRDLMRANLYGNSSCLNGITANTGIPVSDKRYYIISHKTFIRNILEFQRR